MKIPKLLKKFICAIAIFLAAGFICFMSTAIFDTYFEFFPVETTDAREAYRYWAREEPPADMECLAGVYWGNVKRTWHLGGTWKTYLKLKPSQAWWDQFVKWNKLVEAEIRHSAIGNAPDWFQPSESFILYRKANLAKEDWSSARYYRDPETGIVYIYEWSI